MVRNLLLIPIIFVWRIVTSGGYKQIKHLGIFNPTDFCALRPMHRPSMIDPPVSPIMNAVTDIRHFDEGVFHQKLFFNCHGSYKCIIQGESTDRISATIPDHWN